MKAKGVKMRSYVAKESRKGGDVWDYVEKTGENQNLAKR